MFIKPNDHSFLTGTDPFFKMVPLDETKARVDEELVFEPHHEGFIGIPHGGLPMGLCLDAWRRTREPSYPAEVNFKFGGSGIKIGEKAVFTVEQNPEDGKSCFSAHITKNGDKTPYLRAEIRSAATSDNHDGIPAPPTEHFRGLPYYRNCFVCGHHRTITGLQRRFRLHESDGATVITTPWGYDATDGDRSENFLIGEEELHPAVLISIFDENTAWGGFMMTRAAGLSVRVEFTLLRPVSRREKLLFVSEPTGTRGNPRKPRFFLAKGTILSMTDPGRPEPVAYGRGEWLIADQYTQQIKRNLLPEDDWSWIFPDKVD
ncbi:MAG: hypothetical protein WBG50_14730 [Desulfomonilaceae bacterium]